MRTLNKLILLIILPSTLFGCGQQATSEDFDADSPIIPQIVTTPTSVPITPTPINHPLVTGNTPAPINQPLVEATRIPLSTFVPKLIDDGVPELLASVNNIFFDGFLDDDGIVTIGESSISAYTNSQDQVLLRYRMPSPMTELSKGSFGGRVSLDHSRDILSSHKYTKIYEDGTVRLAHIDDFSHDPFSKLAITNDLTLVQLEVQNTTDQVMVPAPVIANIANQQSVQIALNVPTTVSTPSGPFEIYLENSYLYTSDQPGSDASTGYKMQVWIQQVKP